MMNTLCLFLALSFTHSCLGQVSSVRGPQNQAVIASSPSVMFTCTVTQNSALTSYVGWEECITPGGGNCLRIFNDLQNVYVGSGGDPNRVARYGITNPSTPQYDLSISPLVMDEDSGKYRCVSLNNAAFYRTAELILLDDNPDCTTNVTNNQATEGDIIRYTCEVAYRGRWAPVMEWDEKGVPVNNVIDESTSNVARYSIIIQVTVNNNGDVYRCRTFFNAPTGLEENEAGNAPEYQYSFTYPELSVVNSPTTEASPEPPLTMADLTTGPPIQTDTPTTKSSPEPPHTMADLTMEPPIQPSVVAFEAAKYTDQQMQDDDFILFEETKLNVGNGYNNMTGKFTAPMAGIYSVHLHMCSVGFMWYHLRVNGLLVAGLDNMEYTDSLVRDVHQIDNYVGRVLYLNTGDVIDVLGCGQTNTGCSGETKCAFDQCSFGGFLISTIS